MLLRFSPDCPEVENAIHDLPFVTNKACTFIAASNCALRSASLDFDPAIEAGHQLGLDSLSILGHGAPV